MYLLLFSVFLYMKYNKLKLNPVATNIGFDAMHFPDATECHAPVTLPNAVILCYSRFSIIFVTKYYVLPKLTLSCCCLSQEIGISLPTRAIIETDCYQTVCVKLLRQHRNL